jgi:hypothetical protein
MVAHLRVVPPALSIPILLGHYALVLRARIRGGRRPALAAAASFGLDDRLALNLFLLGNPPAAARRLVELPAGHLSWEARARRDPVFAARQSAHRRALIDQIWDNPAPWLATFGISHVVRRAALGSDPTPPFPVSLITRRTRAGHTWDVWQIAPTP